MWQSNPLQQGSINGSLEINGGKSIGSKLMANHASPILPEHVLPQGIPERQHNYNTSLYDEILRDITESRHIKGIEFSIYVNR